jgi:hypothetical membrane protein
MELTTRGLWTMLHGMAFGALYLFACSGAFIALRQDIAWGSGARPDANERFLRLYFVAMAVLAWLTVLTGTYIVYPWYRAAIVGTAALSGFPQHLLLSSPSTAAWHTLGMEWKEHVAWLTPIGITTAAVVVWQYGRSLADHVQLRRAVLGFVAVSFLAAAIAGFFGAMINKHAPVEGGNPVHLMKGR